MQCMLKIFSFFILWLISVRLDHSHHSKWSIPSGCLGYQSSRSYVESIYPFMDLFKHILTFLRWYALQQRRGGRRLCNSPLWRQYPTTLLKSLMAFILLDGSSLLSKYYLRGALQSSHIASCMTTIMLLVSSIFGFSSCMGSPIHT
jgi:hypothetical protein